MRKIFVFVLLSSVFFCTKRSGVRFEDTSYAELLQQSRALGKPVMVDVFSDG